MPDRRVALDRQTRPVISADWRRRVSFLCVGAFAAAIHFGVVVALVEGLALHPLVANVAGWISGFGLSLAGHHAVTFRGHGRPARTVASRFALVAVAGFAANEATFALLRAATALRYEVALVLTLLAVAAASYAMSRHWVFADDKLRSL